MFRQCSVIFVAGLLAGAASAVAQQQVPPPLDPKMFQKPAQGAPQAPSLSQLSPEQQDTLRRIAGTSPKGSWDDFLKSWLTPQPIPRAVALFIDDKYAYPHAAVSIKMKIVPDMGDEETVWLVGIPPEDPESPLHPIWLDRQKREIFFKMQRAWEEEHGEDELFLEFGGPVVPPPFADALQLEPLFAGLPNGGLWQMSFAVADMNGDGLDDLLFPPTRKGSPAPAIFLREKDGGFKLWENVAWRGKVPFDYGGIAAGDFDGDGHQDVVLGIHFKGQYVFYGNGAGTFDRSQLLPNPDPRVTSRAPTVADFDLDGRLDVAFLAEIDYDLTSNARYTGTTTVWLVLNKDAGWKAPMDFVTYGVIGDNLTSGDVDGDGRPDLILSSNSTNYRQLVIRNLPGLKWQPLPYMDFLSNAIHPETAFYLAPDGSRQLASTFVQFLMAGDVNLALTGIVAYPVDAAGAIGEVEVVVSDDQRFNPYFRLAVGDLNGDGFFDIAAGRKGGQLELFTQTADGLFYLESSPELEDVYGTPFDLQLVDVDGDGRDDLIAMFAEKEERQGGARIWLSRPRS